MTDQVPQGYVDPADERQVAGVLAAVLQVLGPAGLGDLLGRIPGSRVEDARPGAFFKAPVPASVWLSAEHQLVLTDPVVHAHVVGGVVLARDALPPGRLPEAVARLLVSVVAEQGSRSEAAVALTAAREATERLRP